jgi:hypothetical protein
MGIRLGGYFMSGPGPLKPETVPICNAFSIPFTRPTATPFDINVYKTTVAAIPQIQSNKLLEMVMEK